MRWTSKPAWVLDGLTGGDECWYLDREPTSRAIVATCMTVLMTTPPLSPDDDTTDADWTPLAEAWDLPSLATAHPGLLEDAVNQMSGPILRALGKYTLERLGGRLVKAAATFPPRYGMFRGLL